MDSKKYFFLAQTEEQLIAMLRLYCSISLPSVLLWRKGLHRCLPERLTK